MELKASPTVNASDSRAATTKVDSVCESKKKHEGKIDINDSKLFAVSREGACHVRTLSGQSVNPRVCV